MIYLSSREADIAQLVERILGKDEVTGSNPVISSKKIYFSKLIQTHKSIFLKLKQRANC